MDFCCRLIVRGEDQGRTVHERSKRQCQCWAAMLGVFVLLMTAGLAQGRAQAVSTASSSTAAVPMTQAEKTELANHVRREYLHAWEGYREICVGTRRAEAAEQAAISTGMAASLLMTPVDALDTLILMGLKPQADEARKLIDTKLDFDQDIYVKDFEITIRLMGGLLSSYELTGRQAAAGTGR